MSRVISINVRPMPNEAQTFCLAGSCWKQPRAMLASMRLKATTGGQFGNAIQTDCRFVNEPTASRIAAQSGAPFLAPVSLERQMWLPEDCPLCRAGAPLVDHLA